MRFSSLSAVALAGSAFAAVTPYECLANSGNDIAALSDCGHQGVIGSCLSQLRSYSIADIKACYTEGGCGVEEAENEASAVLKRCEAIGKAGELRRRFHAMPIPRAPATESVTATSDSSASSSASTSQTGVVKSGDACFTTTLKSTSDCPLTTSGGKTSTGSCTSTQISVSKCAPSMLCTKDSNEHDICMIKKGMGVSGIVVTIVFIGSLAIGFITITYMCFRDSKEQKRLTAKAEAVALARAATKKQRSQESRAPLMQGQSQTSAGSDPFQDQGRS